MRWHKYGSTFVQVMASCLATSSHYLNQCRCIIKGVHLRTISPEILINLIHNRWDYTLQTTTISPNDQWVNIAPFLYCSGGCHRRYERYRLHGSARRSRGWLGLPGFHHVREWAARRCRLSSHGVQPWVPEVRPVSSIWWRQDIEALSA